MKNYVNTKYKIENIIDHTSNNQIYLNHKIIVANNLGFKEVQDVIARYILKHKAIDKVFTRYQLENTTFSSGSALLIQKGFNQQRSGDVFYVLNPSIVAYSRTGSAHGSNFNYDTHVPLLFYGKGISKGMTLKKTYVEDIAPTMCALLGVAAPNGATGKIIPQVIK